MVTLERKLENLASDVEARQKYEDAIRVLFSLGIFDLLRELVIEDCTTRVGADFGKEFDLASYYRLIGYKECLHDLQNLIKDNTKVANLPLDFGASSELLQKGYSQEEVNIMLGDK